MVILLPWLLRKAVTPTHRHCFPGNLGGWKMAAKPKTLTNVLRQIWGRMVAWVDIKYPGLWDKLEPLQWFVLPPPSALSGSSSDLMTCFTACKHCLPPNISFFLIFKFSIFAGDVPRSRSDRLATSSRSISFNQRSARPCGRQMSRGQSAKSPFPKKR